MASATGVGPGVAVGIRGVAVGNGVIVGSVATGLAVGVGLPNGTERKAEASAVAASVGKRTTTGGAVPPQPANSGMNSATPAAVPKTLDISIGVRCR